MNPHSKQTVSRAVCLLAVIFSGFLMMPQATTAQTFVFGRADFPVANTATSLITADFNGDGIPDFAVLNSS